MYVFNFPLFMSKKPILIQRKLFVNQPPKNPPITPPDFSENFRAFIIPSNTPIPFQIFRRFFTSFLLLIVLMTGRRKLPSPSNYSPRTIWSFSRNIIINSINPRIANTPPTYSKTPLSHFTVSYL